ALNRTVVGFSHADDTFGWRFYPRVQTPPVPGNLETVFRDLLVGGQGAGYYLRRRRLEPGLRECVALVVMPSFVPQLSVEVCANWFKPADPKCKERTAAQAMRLSKRVQTLRGQAAGACDADCYRPGDAGLLARRVEQLSERLPLQSQLVNVPYENTHGGFTMFSSGTTDLAPELTGWYGGPGIAADGPTSLFLVGDHFSVHQTRVIIGNVALSSDLPYVPVPDARVPGKDQCAAKKLEVELLSRQVMRITVPQGGKVNAGPDGMVDVHVATPYGVSRNLAVPLLTAMPPAPPAYGYAIAAGKGEVTIAYRVTEKADRNLGYQRVGGVKGSFVFDWKAPTGSAL